MLLSRIKNLIFVLKSSADFISCKKASELRFCSRFKKNIFSVVKKVSSPQSHNFSVVKDPKGRNLLEGFKDPKGALIKGPKDYFSEVKCII